MKPIESMIPQLCTGWVARYELWLVEGEPRCFADASLPLDPAEIQLQFCRSMWQEDPTHSSGHWRIQLPTALDPQNRLAFIIQTVYYFSVATDKTAHMYAVRLPLHVDPDWKSPFPTPQTSEKISFSGLLKPLWGLRRSKSANGHPETFPKQSGSTSSKIWSRSSSRPLSWRPASQRGGPGQLYRHWIAFAHHGTFLFFLDHTEENQQSNVRFPSNLILYKIDAAEDLKISLVASTRMTLCSATQIGPPKVQWHPKESVLVVFFPRAGGGSPVITWRYEEGSHCLTLLPHRLRTNDLTS